MKNIKSMIIPVLGVVALAAGNFLGLSSVQIDTITKDLDSIVTVIASLAGFWGIWKSHEKKITPAVVVKEVEQVAKDAVVKEVEAVVAPEDKPAVDPAQK